MKTADLDYELPPELIAQTPIEPRDQARLLVIDRGAGQLTHTVFHDIGRFLRSGDLLVANDSRVLPARLKGHKRGSGGEVEALLLQPETPGIWRALVKPGRRVRPGAILDFAPLGPSITEAAADGRRPGGAPGRPLPALSAEVTEQAPGGVRLLRFSLQGQQLEQALELLGTTPLPPYIHQPLADPERYQTVYARPKGSVAAPTAGLHFTPQLLRALKNQGIDVVYTTCHIGLHTFRPIQAEDIASHDIHQEWCRVPASVADACNRAHAARHRVVAVGTSTVRALETAWDGGGVRPFEGWTRLYIYPGYRYKAVDAMVTNFHLPRTTLMALVIAFASQELIRRAYAEAIARRYRFYSFGDSCLIL